MFEGSNVGGKTPEKKSLAQLDNQIANTLEALEATGLNMARWNAEYEKLPDDPAAFEAFQTKLSDFEGRRSEALASFEFDVEVTPEEAEKIRHFDREIMSAFKDFDNYLGNGATAEVYALRADDTICVKFITDQGRYNENNHMRVEYERLAQVYKHTRGLSQQVKVPHPIFLRIHAKEGHSYGMEKIHGQSLSRILEAPDENVELIAIAAKVDRTALLNELLAFVSAMHESGVTHCDLYKRNIMLDKDGHLCVIDFGKAKLIEYKGDREDRCKSDVLNAQQSLRDFFAQIDALTNTNN
jgi:tRNA A-37 threonylcarbamoyl transferase component Bud32